MNKTQKKLFPEIRTLTEAVDAAFERLGRSNDITEIRKMLESTCTFAELTSWYQSSLNHSIRGVMRQIMQNGEPRSRSVAGKYTEPEQISFEGWIEVAYDHARLGWANLTKVTEDSKLCLNYHEKTFDPKEIIRAAKSGEPLVDLIRRLTAA